MLICKQIGKRSFKSNIQCRRFSNLAPRPLSVFKVLDLSRVLAGPWSTQIFGDLGAEVIKIEHPTNGDDTRKWGPPFYTDNGTQNSAYFSCCNRNKKSVAIDISTQKGQEIIHKMAKECDVVVENFKVDGLTKYGLDYASLSQINPRLVYCSITGFGQTGPLSHLPGYDFAIQAMGGLMSITGPPDQPYKCGVAIVDIMTAMYANVAILSSLHLRNLTGKGQHIDVSLFDVQATFLANLASNYLVSGVEPKRIGNSHASISPYDTLATKDGFIVLAVGNDSQFLSLCNVLKADEIFNNKTLPSFTTNSDRVKNRAPLLQVLEKYTKPETTQHWVKVLGEANVPCSPINTFSQVYNHPHTIARDMIWELPLNRNTSDKNSEDKGTITTVGNPIHYEDMTLKDYHHTPPPILGENTKDVLSDLGLTDSQISTLEKERVVYCHKPNEST
eukprot:TRINITY_DN1375_c0_g1_i5.p1 TRINITY_DN1375_c0_g1~~TRINITY_DN1375_c0_g1_i5.p1  ORF type:complete len:446 (+),score=78.54 TRINITY_DN1375_c0_g1_i5:418-1755(+)